MDLFLYEYRLGRQAGATLWFSLTSPLKIKHANLKTDTIVSHEDRDLLKRYLTRMAYQLNSADNRLLITSLF